MHTYQPATWPVNGSPVLPSTTARAQIRFVDNTQTTGSRESGIAAPGARGAESAASRRAIERRWKRWRVLGRADRLAAGLTALAIVLTAASLLRGPPPTDALQGFVMLAPLVSVLFVIALIAMFLERERHGLVRALLGLGAGVLIAGGLSYANRAPPGTLITAYWVPAALVLFSLFAIGRAKRAVNAR
jgi:hypothetical protein